ncbi:MAG: YabP/YqfC family sporulation protein [Clostridia bacterium]|nr:YabP/YqfC family sporulation protein [Clostridia bacterium]
MRSSERKETVCRRIEERLDLPTGVLSTAPRMELFGNRRVVIEGCESILEYDEDRIRLRTAAGVVRFTGCELCMTCRTPEHAVITGRLVSVEFL